MQQAKLVQSFRFPNIWTLVNVDDDKDTLSFQDRMCANGAIAAEGAVTAAREDGIRITEIVSEHWTDAGDNTTQVIAGIEYRSQRPVLDRYDYVDEAGKRYHVMQVYPNGVASVLVKEHGWNDEIPLRWLTRQPEQDAVTV